MTELLPVLLSLVHHRSGLIQETLKGGGSQILPSRTGSVSGDEGDILTGTLVVWKIE
jgi:hypothetical protein